MNTREAVKLAMARQAAHGEVSPGKVRALLMRRYTNSEMSQITSQEATEADAPFTLKEWLDNNAQYVDAEDIAAMFALEPGESYTTGGGAQGRITTTRVR